MPFDPKQYLARKMATIQSMEAQPPPPEMSSLEAGARGVAQGLTFGFADELSGLGESAFTDKTYEQARDESRTNFDRAYESNPGAYIAGNVGGAVLPALLSGGTSAVGSAAASAGLIGSVGAKTIGGLMAQGALQGGLQGLGESEGKSAGDIAKDVAMGAGLGAATGGALGGLSRLLPGASKATNIIDDVIPENKIASKVDDISEAIIKKPDAPINASTIEKSLGDMQSAAVEGQGVSISRADEIIASMTGKNESLINLLRKDPKQAKQILSILDTAKTTDEFAQMMAEFASADAPRRKGMALAAQGEKLLDESGFMVENKPIVQILSDVYDRVQKSGVGEISSSKTKAKQELERIFYEASKTDVYDTKKIRTLLRDLDDQVNVYGGYANAADKNPAVRDALKRARGEINAFVRNQLPDGVREEYENLYKQSSLEFKKSDILKKSLTSKDASQLQGQDFGGDLGKATTLINQYLSKPNAANEAKIKRLSDIMSPGLGLNLLEELKNTRIKKQIDARGNQGSNIVNAWRGLKDSIPLAKIPILGDAFSKFFAEPQLAVIGKRMETKGGDVAAKWAEHSGELIRQGKTPNQTDAMRFLMREASQDMEPGVMQMLAKRVGLPEKAAPRMNLPSANEPIRQSAPKPTFADTQAERAPGIIRRVQGTKYAPVLQSAAQKGTRNFAVASYLLQQQDENYRNLIEEK